MEDIEDIEVGSDHIIDSYKHNHSWKGANWVSCLDGCIQIK